LVAGRRDPAAPVTARKESAGGVAWRDHEGRAQVALILVGDRRVGDRRRWQLPKGLVDRGETPEQAARREVREEAGIEARPVAPLGTIDYWYQAREGDRRVRYHKFVHFFLMAWEGGDVARHDAEVLEARWVDIDEAISLLAFPTERRILAEARERIRASGSRGDTSS
jgi:8-oxo-dGTP pyrophosphatase MutT (NUDIX family)